MSDGHWTLERLGLEMQQVELRQEGRDKNQDATLERVAVRLDKMDAKIDTIDISIRGNGEPGLNERVGVIEARWKQIVVFVGLTLAIVGAVLA